MHSFNVVTWNVNALNDRIKRTAVVQFFKRQSSSVVLLQETHLLGMKCMFLGRYGYERVFHDGFTRGVAILMKC